MRLYSESKRLRDTQEALHSNGLDFVYNKKQELTRLVYEVSKIKETKPRALVEEAVSQSDFQGTGQAFLILKDYFLRKRYPSAYKGSKGSIFYLPKISFSDHPRVIKKDRFIFSPQKIFVESSASDYNLTKSIISKFPQALTVRVEDLKNYIKSPANKTGIGSYNERTQNIFLVKENYDFLKACPCSKGVLGCGYYVLNLGFGCSYECSYCFLQGYTNVNSLIIPVNIEDYIKNLESFISQHKRALRVGTGEFTDSLALDEVTGFSQALIEFFSRVDKATLELKTKSNNINNLLGLRHNRKAVISWSLNPQPIVESDEWQTNSLCERLDAAKACCQAGYPVGFHFDPIVYSTGWQSMYRELVEMLFQRIKPKDIAWISLGTFRFAPKLKTTIEQRFPESKILDEELIVGFDRKLRYMQRQRIEIYKKMYAWIRKHSSSVWVYLCMEPKEVWKEVLGRSNI